MANFVTKLRNCIFCCLILLCKFLLDEVVDGFLINHRFDVHCLGGVLGGRPFKLLKGKFIQLQLKVLGIVDAKLGFSRAGKNTVKIVTTCSGK